MKRAPMNVSQRMVLVVGVGGALYFLGMWATSREAQGPTGWTAYAPVSSTFLASGGIDLPPWVRLAIWLILVLVWTAISLVVLRTANPGVNPTDSSD